MNTGIRRVAALASIVTIAACSAERTTSPLGQSSGPSLKNGAPSASSVLPSLTGHVDSIGVIPLGFYYGNPSVWVVDGHSFQSQFLTRFKLLNGNIGLGTCVTVSYNPGSDGIDYINDMKSELASTCDVVAAGGSVSGKKVKP